MAQTQQGNIGIPIDPPPGNGGGGQGGMGNQQNQNGGMNGGTNGGGKLPGDNFQPMPGPGPDYGTRPTPSPRPDLGALSQAGQEYIIYGTGQPYRGMVVEVGGQLYTTVGGALEGFSFQVFPAGGQNDTRPRPRPQPQPGPGPQRPQFGGAGAPGLRPSPFPGGNEQNFGGTYGGSLGDSGKLQGDNTDFGDTGIGGDGGIIIDDPMNPDPFANQGGSGY